MRSDTFHEQRAQGLLFFTEEALDFVTEVSRLHARGVSLGMII